MNRESNIENGNTYEESFDDYVYRKLKEAEDNEKNGKSYFTTENIFENIREELNESNRNKK